jgi:hypothetical protein
MKVISKENNMQRIATRVFVYASLAFGALGIVFVLTAPANDNEGTDFNMVLMRLLFGTGFVVLSSFALSVAGKYLNGKD